MSWSAKTFWNNHSWPSSESIGNRGGIVQRNQAQRKILQRSSMKAPCGFFEMPWPSLMSWSALTLSRVRCKLHKQSRLTFSKVSRKSMTESGGLPEVQLESTVSFSKFSPDILRAQNGLMLSLAVIFSDVLIGKDLLKQSLLTFFRVNRESRRNRTNEIRRSERSCRSQTWEHRVAFSRCFDLLWYLDRHWLCQG